MGTSRRRFTRSIATALLSLAFVAGCVGNALAQKKGKAAPSQKPKDLKLFFHNPPVIVGGGSLVIYSRHDLGQPFGSGPFTYRINGLRLAGLKVFVINSDTAPSASLPVTGLGLSAEVYLKKWVGASGEYAAIAPKPEITIRYNALDPVELVSDIKLTCTTTNDPHRAYRCEYKDSVPVTWGRVRLVKGSSEKYKRDAKDTDIDMKLLISDH